MKMPKVFSIETVLGCNLSCLECAIGAGLINRKYGYMSLEKYEVIHQKIKDHAEYIYLHLWGEPLLNKDILPIISMASKTARVNISTNANMITEEYAEKIIASGVQDIIVSIDGVTQRTYGLYRRKGDVNKAMQGLLYLLLQREKQHKNVKITPQFIVFDHNKHEMELFENFCADIGTYPTFKAPYIRNGSYLKGSGIKKYTRPKAASVQNRKEIMRKCSIENEMTILLDGTVVPCCYDHDASTSLGNIYTKSLEEIVAGTQRQEFCHNLACGNTPEFCLTYCLQY